MRIKVLSGGRKNIELSLSDAELNFQMRRIGIEETVPMCRLVEVSEKDNPLHRFEGQTVNMDEVNFFAKRMESLTEYERKVLSAYAEDYGVATMKDLINLTFSMKGLSLLTDFSDARQVGVRLYMDEFLGMSEEEKEQTNFIEFAEKTLKESRVEVLPYGVFVEHGFEMLEVYNGKTFPAFVASEETVAVVEVQNKTGDTEYLYLPTDICSMNKVKERLQVQDYWEMEVIEIENLRLPDILVPTTEDLREVEQLTLFNEMCHVVEVGNHNLPENVIRNVADVEGKYLTTTVYAGDYILTDKISDEPAAENKYLYSLNGEKQAMSITINTFAEGLSGKLKSGDIVSVIAPDYLGSGETIIPVELKYVEVIAVTAKSGYDANTGEQMSEEDEKELPSTVTILVRPEQSKLLARLEAEGEIHLSLVFRGDADKASEFIKAQDQVLDEIKAAEEEALQEEDATEEDGQPVINADGQETTEEEETSTDGEE